MNAHFGRDQEGTLAKARNNFQSTAVMSISDTMASHMSPGKLWVSAEKH
jgi:hypothetical protein